VRPASAGLAATADRRSNAGMSNPYQGLPDHAFWRHAVAGRPEPDVAPVIQAPFRIGRTDRIATAGSCFAQHTSRALSARGFSYLVTEPAPPGAEDEDGYAVFPARFGNIYSCRQLLQTFDRAYGLMSPHDSAWSRPDGALVDPFRPLIRKAGFASQDALEADRARHLGAVREMFESCEVLIFTLGLTEAWTSTVDGAVFPPAPGVAGGSPGPDYAFANFSAGACADDLAAVLDKLRTVNPGVRVMEMFARHFLDDGDSLRPAADAVVLSKADRERLDAAAEVVCDEDAIEGP
jgi:hypothetical protein